MTQAEIKLCSLLLQEHFGEIVEKIGVHLIRTGSQPLRVIAHDTGTSLDQVKKALCVLIHHNLVIYRVYKRSVVEYEAQCSRVLRMLRYPRYIYTTKTLYSDTGELIVEELLLNGKMTMSAVVKKVADRLTETMEDGKTMDYVEVSNAFVRLADTHFVQRCPLVHAPDSSDPEPPPPAPTLVINEKDMYLVPKLSLIGKGKRRRSSDEDAAGEPKAKKPKYPDNKEPSPDDGIYWQVNLERFHQHFRDQAIVSAVANRMDQTSSEIVRTMLRMSEITTPSCAPFTQPLSSNEIFRSLPVGYNISKQVLDQYLTLLADDPLEFIGKSGDSGGGMYVINLHKALASLATATLESVIQERFGSRCARIFRLVLQKKHLEQKQVEDFAMIPAKEAKDMLYKMLSENFISLQEIPKTPDHAPSRTFYLYTVNVLSAARMLLHRCYKSIANLIERRQFETKENRRLLEKSQRVEAIIASMQATGAEEVQLQEIEEMITAPERQQLETLKRNVNKAGTPEAARLTALGHQGAPGKRRPEQRDGCCTVTAAPGWTPRVSELHAECVWSPGRRTGTRAVAHTLQLGARTACPFQPFIPRRLGETSNPGLVRESGVGRESEGGLRTGRVATGQLPPRGPPISESPTPLQSFSLINPLLSETPFLPFCGSGPEAWGLQDRAAYR